MGKDKKFTADKIDQSIIKEFVFFNSKRLENPETLRSYKYNLRKLSNFRIKHTNKPSIKELDENDLRTFFNNNLYVKKGSWNSAGSRIIPFYKWVYKLHRRQRPPNLYWYESDSELKKKRLSDPHRKEKLLIFPEEYESIIKNSNDRYGQTKAIWELYYISGFRPEELPSMLIEDIEIDKSDNIVYASCPKSKVWPRKIPLMEDPFNLKRFIGNHPDKFNKKAPLFFNLNSIKKIKPLKISAIQDRFREIRKELDLKSTLTIKSFRKTRATIMFGSDDSDIKDYDNIGRYMGWSSNTVLARAKEYKLYNMDDLKKALCKKPMVSKGFDDLEDDLKNYEDKYKPQMEKQSKLIKEQAKLIKDMDRRIKERDEDNLSFKEEVTISLQHFSNLINKQLFSIEFVNKYRRIKPKPWKNLKELKELLDKEYNNWPNKIEFKSVEDFINFKNDTITPRVKALLE